MCDARLHCKLHSTIGANLARDKECLSGMSCGDRRLESACYTVSLGRLGKQRQPAAHSVSGLLATTVYNGTLAVKEIGMLPHL